MFFNIFILVIGKVVESNNLIFNRRFYDFGCHFFNIHYSHPLQGDYTTKGGINQWVIS
nr:MAG TPA: hypothetical protein [Caudoviricetes sp.]